MSSCVLRIAAYMCGLLGVRKDKEWIRALGQVAGRLVVDARRLCNRLKKTGIMPGARRVALY